VLRGSRAEHLYSRCGFVPNNDEGVDVYLRRDPDGTPPVRTSTIHRDGLVQLEHEFTLPLDHSAPNAEQITVFARELFRPELDTAHREQHGSPLPTLVWFQGGPGFGADRPTAQPSGWINTALARFRVLLLDQRGTGRSSIVDARTLPQGTAQQQATFLSLFRADSIVRDAEAIRSILIGDRPWSVLGQSFGGFCILSYLSMAPEGLSAAMITGGVADIQSDPLSIYRRTFEQTRVRNADYFERYPEDRDRVTRIVQLLRRGEHRLPTGETLTPERFLQLGILLGSANGFDRLHYLVERALTGYAAADDLSAAFLADVGAELSFAANPLYAALHEAIYAPTAPAWAAQRARDERPEFSPDAEVPLFTGEMIFPWHFEQDPSLHVFAAATEILEHRTDWPPLYDLERLATNTVPVAAVSYSQDMYVPIDGSLRTGHAVAGMQIIVDDVHHHDGVRQDGPGLLDRLLEATTPAPTPTKRSTTPQ
ncbi:MAG: alpha/beta fold hydrolase, partial [Mycetocola sp.]